MMTKTTAPICDCCEGHPNAGNAQYDPAGEAQDPDGDGRTNVEEYLNATDPREADDA
ncbi:MAG: hypothetical protein ACOCX2_12330 [Armatimonadota bacterium]